MAQLVFLSTLVLVFFSVFGQTKYEILDETYGEGTPDAVHLKVLRNTETLEQFGIVLDQGGRIEGLHLRQEHSGRLVSVLANHSKNAKAIRKNAHWYGAILAPFANRIKNGTYFFDGKTHYLPINEPARDCALHGLLINKKMKVMSSHTNEKEANVILGYHFDGTDPGYPFHLDLNLSYTLFAHHFTLTATARNVNPNGRALPFYFSAHPYFLVSDVSKAVLHFDNCTRWAHIEMPTGAPRDGDLIPTGVVEPSQNFVTPTAIGGTKEKPTYFDDEYAALDSRAKCSTITQRIYDPITGNVFRLYQDRNFRFAQIFTGSRELWNLSAIALEPMSAEADAYNNHQDLTVLSAGEVWQGGFGIAS